MNVVSFLVALDTDCIIKIRDNVNGRVIRFNMYEGEEDLKFLPYEILNAHIYKYRIIRGTYNTIICIDIDLEYDESY